MIYAEVDGNEQFVRETRNFDPPLTTEELETSRLPNGSLSLRELILVEHPFDPSTEKQNGFLYQVGPDSVKKIRVIAPLTNDEKLANRRAEVIGSRTVEQCDHEQDRESIYRVLVALIDFAAMLETPVNKLNVKREDFDRIVNRLAIFEANPIPK